MIHANGFLFAIQTIRLQLRGGRKEEYVYMYNIYFSAREIGKAHKLHINEQKLLFKCGYMIKYREISLAAAKTAPHLEALEIQPPFGSRCG